MRITVKIGSNVLTRADGSLDVTRMSALVDQVASLRRHGIEVLMVSSGAMASGRSELKHIACGKMDAVDQRQLFSAVGQAKLINRYYEMFRDHGIAVGQVLTMKENFGTRRHYLNQRNCISVMLDNGVIPVINENDTISVTELMFTDNDELSGLIATMMDCDALVILSNIDGVYNGNPSAPESEIIRTVEPGKDISEYISTVKSGFGRGGMQTKSNIARKVAQEGVAVVIANGKRENILLSLLPVIEAAENNGGCKEERIRKALSENSTTPCTVFLPADTDVSSVKKWIAHSGGFAKGAIWLNKGASEKIQGEQAASILPVGITKVEGDFETHDIISIYDHHGTKIGVGRTDYDSGEVQNAIGKRDMKPVVHYDFLYLE